MISKLIASGYAARRGGRLEDAKSWFQKAIAVSRETSDQRNLAEALTGLGQIERDLGDVALAIEQYEQAEEIFRSLEDPSRLAHTLRHIGDMLREAGSIAETGRAQACYEETLLIYRNHARTSDLDLANALRGFALLRERTGEKHGAVELWIEARRLYDRTAVHAGVEEADAHINQ